MNQSNTNTISNTPTPTNSRILLKQEVKEILRIKSDSSLQAMINRGEFPQGMKVGLRRVGWYENEVYHWLAQRDHERQSTGV